MAKKKRSGILVKVIPGKKGYWEIFAVYNSKRKKSIRFKGVDGKTYEGYYEFATRLISRNGNLLSTNPKQFNQIAGGVKNIMAVKNSC